MPLHADSGACLDCGKTLTIGSRICARSYACTSSNSSGSSWPAAAFPRPEEIQWEMTRPHDRGEGTTPGRPSSEPIATSSANRRRCPAHQRFSRPASQPRLNGGRPRKVRRASSCQTAHSDALTNQFPPRSVNHFVAVRRLAQGGGGHNQQLGDFVFLGRPACAASQVDTASESPSMPDFCRLSRRPLNTSSGALWIWCWPRGQDDERRGRRRRR